LVQKLPGFVKPFKANWFCGKVTGGRGQQTVNIDTDKFCTRGSIKKVGKKFGRRRAEERRKKLVPQTPGMLAQQTRKATSWDRKNAWGREKKWELKPMEVASPASLQRNNRKNRLVDTEGVMASRTEGGKGGGGWGGVG